MSDNQPKKYGETESDKWARSMMLSRNIVSEVLDFGVNQDQINQIIGLLALELENREHVNAYRGVYKNILEGNEFKEKNVSKIILDS
jgi:hypothetical protein